MAKPKGCACEGHEKDHHKKMNQTEKMKHFIECFNDIFERMNCLKEALDDFSAK
ncbi:MAG: hypothetical protein ACFFB3_21000 [Candidatus Hodarchaeota archaeon]